MATQFEQKGFQFLISITELYVKLQIFKLYISTGLLCIVTVFPKIQGTIMRIPEQFLRKFFLSVEHWHPTETYQKTSCKTYGGHPQNHSLKCNK